MKNVLIYLILLYFAGSASASSNTNSLYISVTRERLVVNYKLNSDLNRTAFYRAMQSNNQALVDAQISELNLASSYLTNAFLGAMTMKKAGIGGNPFYKLWLFKKGHELLEDAIKQDPNN